MVNEQTAVEGKGTDDSGERLPSIAVWGFELPGNVLDEAETEYLKSLPLERPSVEWVWQEMDRVWDESRLDNSRPLAGQDIGRFYGHPIWMVNGIFTSVDPESIQHRIRIAESIAALAASRLADYGGGFGQLSSEISRLCPATDIDIIEPYPTRYLVDKVCREARVRIASVPEGTYDTIVAQDVLEHLEDPVGTAILITRHVHAGGTVVYANCFYPFIKCHLPRTFFLRHTFRFVMRALGLRFIRVIPGAEHAEVYERGSQIHPRRARAAEQLVRAVGPFANRLFLIRRFVGAFVRRRRST